MSRSASAAGGVPVTATPARVWSCWLGGKDGTAAGREAARAVQRAWPGAVAAAQAGREFGRTVTWHAAFSRGIRQVLDVGAMLPVPGLFSEAGGQALRDCRVVRAASGPPAAGPEAGTGAAQVFADVCDPASLLAAAGKILDFTEPVVVLLVAVLDFITFSDRFKINNFVTCCFTSRTCSRRSGPAISDEEVGSVVGSAGPLSVITSERRERPWPERSMGPGRFHGATGRTSRTPQGPVGKIPDDDSPAQTAGDLAAALAPGSLIAVSHMTADQAPGQVSAGIAAWNARVPAAWQPRSRAAVAALLGGLPLPGLVPASWWRAIPGKGLERPGDAYGGVAGLPGDPAAIVTGALAGQGFPT